ncbi:MAG: hypothetical protein EBS84_07585 [Proteobacteria bacterium]|nr:hypothetical protein [Verrucomicrobiota bacterium]NBU08860.1 hypothetical protein [Pseudomonadota bacterium]
MVNFRTPIPTNKPMLARLLLGTLVFNALTLSAAEKPQLLEAEDHKPKTAAVYADARASGKKSVIAMLPAVGRVFEFGKDLPAGDYLATAWIEAVPASLLHTLAVTFKADGAARVIDQAQLDARPGFRPFQLRFFHPGGKVSITLDAAGKSGFDQMRASPGDAEKGVAAALDIDESTSGKQKKADANRDELSELLEGAKSAESLKPTDLRVACDRVELTLLRAAPVAVASVAVDKIHYAPGDTVSAQAELLGGAAGGAFTFRAEVLTELDAAREVFTANVQLAPGERKELPFQFKLGNAEFGHELRGVLVAGGTEVHSSSEFFGVSKNVYRVGITGRHVGQSTRNLTPERAAETMAANVRAYANYFECFAWAPCDYSDLTPKTEEFVSGQTQYPGSVAGMKLQLAEAHRRGIKAITYGKACAAGISGFLTYQQHPEFFGHSFATGPATEQMSTFLLERMLENDYNFNRPSDGGWRHWASLWTRFDFNPAVDFGADELVRSAEIFGWDGVRWDGHFVENQRRCIDRINAKRPGYVHGYNSAFANCGSKLFLPPDQSDFHDIAKAHGLIMDESVRGHSRWTDGSMRTFYEGICREADYVKRIGGLPLFITFDMGSRQDVTWNVLSGLAAGQRYTYLTSPGDYAFGTLPKFLTRYSAFVWDDTAMVANEAQHLAVTLAPGSPTNAAVWFDQSTWLRKLTDGRQQVLLHLLNFPGYRHYAQRVQTPPTWLSNVTVSVKLPAGAQLARAFHVSPDLVEGHHALTPKTDGTTATLVLPEVKLWSIVVLEFSGGANYPLTTPVEDATKHFAEEKQKKEHEAKLAAEKSKASIGTPVAASPAATDLDANADPAVLAQHFKNFTRPASPALRRNGVVDVHHARGAFAWLNPVDIALQLAGGGNYTPSWVDRVGFRLGPGGSMEDFPDSYDALFENDVLVLDNVQAADLGALRRTMIADFVRAGGGLLVMGGWFNLSQGADRNTSLAELLPVTITKQGNLATNAAGFALTIARTDFFPKVDWVRAGVAFQVDQSPVKAGAEVLAKAGPHPAIVAGTCGAGRVVVVLANPHGEPAKGTLPYWQSPEWPRVLAACLAYLAKGSEAVSTKTLAKRALDKKKVLPDDLMLDASSLAAPELAKRLRSARDNIVDTETAQTVLRVALDNKVTDTELLTTVVEAAGPFMDASFAPLGVQMAQSDLDVLRRVGYRVLGLAKNKAHRPLVEKGLKESNVECIRAALVALGEIGDPVAAPAVTEYLAGGTEKLLAISVLRRLGTPADFAASLELYAHALRRLTELHSGRKSVLNTLYGGMAFSLTPAQRRLAQGELRTVQDMEARARHDSAYFAASLGKLNDTEWRAFTSFLAQTKNAAVAPLAHATFGKLPREQTKPWRTELAKAQLPQIRLLAEE